MPLKVRSKLQDYEVIVQLDDAFVGDLSRIENGVFVVDENVWRLHQAVALRRMPAVDPIILPIKEEGKVFSTVEKIYDELIKRSAKKNMTLIAIGGGILQDIVGFAASTLYRGVDWIFVPTTLLAQADSCIGGKTSLNYKNYKNLVGTFYPPGSVHIYPAFLKTLSEQDYYSGVGEMVKLHMISGEKAVHEMIDNLKEIEARDATSLLKLINASLLVKKGFIEEDEFDAGRRNILNFGHCFGHAIESATDYQVPHGQAVLLGIWLANIVSSTRGWLAEKTAIALQENMIAPLIKVKLDDGLDKVRIIAAMKMDKKRTNQNLAIVLMKDNYEFVRVNDLTPREAEAAIERLNRGR